MELDSKQSLLFEFVKSKHKDQKRKYTNEPYYNHLYNVAKIVSTQNTECIEVALCHDLFEDTDCTFDELYNHLIRFGYTEQDSHNICFGVNELTDVFTSKDYPHLNRAKRKENEAQRLGNISAISQSVKYADLIDNTGSIVQYDKSFAKVYLKEKEAILKLMNRGDQTLYAICIDVLEKALSDLE